MSEIIYREIYYLGDDDGFCDELEKYMVEMLKPFPKEKHRLTKINWREARDYEKIFYHELLEKIPHLIFLDFVSIRDLPETVSELAYFLQLIKKHTATRPSPIVGLFQTREMIEEVRHLFNYGISYAFIKGDSRTIFRDSYYLGFAQRPPFPKVARAHRVNLEHKLSLICTLRSIATLDVEIECDLYFQKGDEFKLSLNLFELINAQKFVVDGSLKRPCSDHLYVNQCKIPYLSPWETPESEDVLMEDTVETWLANNADNLRRVVGEILLVDGRLDLLYHLKGILKERHLLINYYSHLDEKMWIIDSARPQLIFISLDNPDESTAVRAGHLPNQIESVATLVNYIKTIDDYVPRVVVFNTPSSSVALQKVFHYENVISSREVMSIELFNSMVCIFEKNAKERGEMLLNHYFHPDDRRAYSSIELPIVVSSFTEHEITFYSTTELPLYAVCALDVPIPLYVTIVPAIFELEKREGYFHYMGFFHGISSEDRSLLRRFTYQLIYKPPTKFRFDPYFILEKEEEEKREKELVKMNQGEKSEEKPIVKDKSESFEVSRDKRFKSKL